MPDFSTALEAAREELARLRRDRQSLDDEIAKMENVVAALCAVTQQDEQAMQTSGLTDAIRGVLKGAPEGLSPIEVRSRLDAAGFDFSARYTNVLANIHIVLKRLEQNNEAIVIEMENATGKRYYWALNPPPLKMSVGELLATLGDVKVVGTGTVEAPLLSPARRRLNTETPASEPRPTISGLRRRSLTKQFGKKDKK